MSHLISSKNLIRIKQYLPDFYQIGSNKVFQLALLQLTNSQNINWAYHPNIQQIKNQKVNATRLVVQGLFQNHLVDWDGIKTRCFDLPQYQKYDAPDLYQAFYRKPLQDKTDSKPEQRKNFFVYCPNFNIQMFRYKNFLYRKHLNKIICLPHEKLPQLSPEIQSMCIALNIKILPMRQCNYQNICSYINNNYKGNILLNGAFRSHDFLLSKQSKLKPKQMMIFLDKNYNHRDRSKKTEFPSMQTLLNDYSIFDQHKMDARMMYVMMVDKNKMYERKQQKRKQDNQKQDKTKEKQEKVKPSSDERKSKKSART